MLLRLKMLFHLENTKKSFLKTCFLIIQNMFGNDFSCFKITLKYVLSRIIEGIS